MNTKPIQFDSSAVPAITTLRAALGKMREGYCVGCSARNATGKAVGSCSSDAVAWSLDGAIDHVVAHDEARFWEAWQWLMTRTGIASPLLVRKFDRMSPTAADKELAKLLVPTAEVVADEEALLELAA